MSIQEKTFIETNEKYGDGFAIDEYQGEYFLTRVQRGQDGNLYQRWMKPFIRKDELSEKPMPWKIGLGNKQQAIQRLEQLMMHIEGRQKQRDESYPGDDIPY